jgi:predicted glycosyltransferase
MLRPDDSTDHAHDEGGAPSGRTLDASIDPKNKRVMVWFETGRGDGHAQVVSRTTRELVKQGCRVLVLTGSAQAFSGRYDFGEGVEVVRLPGFKSNPAYVTEKSTTDAIHQQLTSNNLPIAEDLPWHRGRAGILQKLFSVFKPNVVLTEMWPIQRNNHNHELSALMETIHAMPKAEKPKVFCLSRDIMLSGEKNSWGKIYPKEKALEYLTKYYDGGIIVRGDSNIIPLEKSWGQMPTELKRRTYSAGYFVEPSTPEQKKQWDKERKTGDIIVSSGGSVTTESMVMFKAAMSARAMSAHMQKHPMRIIAPLRETDPLYHELEAHLQSLTHRTNIIIESSFKHSTAQFKEMLQHAALSISHGGTTIPEALSMGTPVVAVPRVLNASNLEQQMRTEAFAQKQLIKMIKPTPDQVNLGFLSNALLEQCEAAMAPRKKFGRAAAPEVQIDGARRAAIILAYARVGHNVGDDDESRHRVGIRPREVEVPGFHSPGSLVKS